MVDRLLPSWSKDRDPTSANFKAFAEEPSLTLAARTDAYKFAHEDRPMKSRRDGARRVVLVKASDGQLDLTDDDVRPWLRRAADHSWEGWADLVQDRSAFWRVEVRDDDWRGATCDFPVYQKNSLCKHSLGVPIRLRLAGVVVPEAAKTLPLDQRRKRGRPALARRALQLQP